MRLFKIGFRGVYMKKTIIKFIQILFGNACMAFAVSTLILENGIVCGGVSGIGSAMEHYFNMNLSLVVAILNVGLFILGLWSFGKEFAMSIVVSTFAFPAFLEVFESIPELHGYLNDSLLAMVIGGCLVGFGIGMVIKVNASTGGVEILAQFIHKQFKVPVHTVLNIIDLTILVLQITFSNTTNIIYGIIMTFVTSSVLKRTLLAGKSLIQLTVISDKFQEIREAIIYEMDAGVTMLNSQKGYTEKDSKLVMSVIPYHKLPSIKEKIQEIDPTAFVIVSKVEEVGGQGFTLERRPL